MKIVKLFWLKLLLIVLMIFSIIFFISIFTKKNYSVDNYTLYINDNNRKNVIREMQDEYGLKNFSYKLKEAKKLEFYTVDGKNECKIEYNNGSVEYLSYSSIVDILNYIEVESSEKELNYAALDIIFIAFIIFLYKKVNNEIKFTNKFEERENE